MDLSYEASVEPQALPGRAYPHLPEGVSPQSQGEEIGQGIENAGTVAQSVYEKQLTRARETQVMDANNQLQALSLGLTHDPQTGAFTKQGKDAFGLNGQYLPQFDTQARQILANIPDPQAQQQAALAAAHARNQLSEQLDSHELEQHRQFDLKTTQASIDIAQQAGAANYNHPDILASNHDTIGLSIDRLGQQQGWTDEEIAEAKQKAFSSFHSDVIDRMLTDDKPQLAKAYLSTAKANMDARTAWTADRMIDAHIKEKQNEQKQDIADRFADSMDAARAGLKNPVTVTRAEMDILYPKDAQRRWDGLQGMVQAGAQAREYDHMTPAEIQADLQKNTVTEGGPEAAFALQGQRIREEAAARSIRSRLADPAQFAITSGAGWNPINLQDPKGSLAELRSRANTAAQVSDQIGVPVPLLSKEEARQFTDSLQQSSPRSQVGILRQLQSTLPDGAYQNVLAQIAPHSPVLAVAGALANPPPKAQHPSWYEANFEADPRTSERILEGEQLLSGKGEEKVGKGKGGFAMPADTDLSTQFQAATGGNYSNLFQGRTQTAELYYTAYRDMYASLASEKGITTGVIDSDLAHQAAQAVLGNHVVFNHTDLVAPRGMDPSDFEDNATRAVQQTLKGAGYNEADIRALSDTGLRELGNQLGTGRYAIVDGNGRALTARGKSDPLIVDLRQVPASTRDQDLAEASAQIKREALTRIPGIDE